MLLEKEGWCVFEVDVWDVVLIRISGRSWGMRGKWDDYDGYWYDLRWIDC